MMEFTQTLVREVAKAANRCNHCRLRGHDFDLGASGGG